MTDFAAAQQRIHARRAASAAQQRSLALQHVHERNSRLSRLPPSIRTAAFGVTNVWDLIQSPFGTRPAFRVGQVDAELLDEELLDLLKNQAGEGLKLLGAHLKDDWAAEIGAVLRTALWKLSIWDHGASYGASLQGLRYVDARSDDSAVREATKWQRIAYGLITVGGRYGWSRWEERLSSLENGYDEPSPIIQRLSKFTSMATNTHSIAAFFSFLIFLYNGRYRTLTDRILRLRLVPSTNQTSREVSFEYLNRQLVWHAFTEFLLFLLPLVGIGRWRRWLAKAWKKVGQTATRMVSGTSRPEEEDMQAGELAFLPERTCAICYQDQNPAGGQSEQEVISAGSSGGVIGSAATDITNPYETIPCGCIYCFVCLAQRIEAEEGEGFTCLRCGELAVKSCRPWNGDVLTPTSTRSNGGSEYEKPSRRKSVAFADDFDTDRIDSANEVNDAPLSNVDPMPVEDDEADWSTMDVRQTGYDG
jgi:peroxin-2